MGSILKDRPIVGAAPRNWERAFGYPGEARYVAFFWSPYGDEAMYSDGQVEGDGSWALYLDLVDQRLDLSAEEILSLGSSETEATHHLLLDRETRKFCVLPAAEAAGLLQGQHLPATPLSPEQSEELFQRLVAGLEEARRRAGEELDRGITLCATCSGIGWTCAADGGYDPCPACDGRGYTVTGQ